MYYKSRVTLNTLFILTISFIIAFCFIFRNKVETAYANTSEAIEDKLLQIKNDPASNIGPGDKSIPADNPDHFSFAILGDTQTFDQPGSEGGFKKSVKLIENKVENKEIDLVMTVGDLIQNCTSEVECMDYKNWKEIAKPLLSITYEVMGNHDRLAGDISDAAWQNFFNLPANGPAGEEGFVYSFDHGNSHFVVLNSEKSKEHRIDEKQLEWLKNDLENNKKENTFVFYHEPAFPSGYQLGGSLDYYKKDRDNFWSIIDEYNVTAVFSGHEHMYSRKEIDSSVFPGAKNGIYQFITGGTDADTKPNSQIKTPVDFFYKENGFVIVDVNGREITVKLLSNDDGSLIDSFTFSK